MSKGLGLNPRKRISALDRRVLEWLHRGHTPHRTRAMRAITELGSLAGIASVASATAFALWTRNQRRSAMLVASAAAGAGALSEGLKRLFARQRPELGLRLAETIGFAFPSGHSAASAATYGALALLLGGSGHRWAARAVATLVPASVGASRVYLHVHFPSDVVVGWVIGAAWLAVVRALVGVPCPR